MKRYEAKFGLKDLDRHQIYVEAVRDVYVNMIYDTPEKRFVIVSVEKFEPPVQPKDRNLNEHGWVFKNGMSLELKSSDEQFFPVANFDEALKEFNRQINFLVGMYSQGGRKVFASKSKYVHVAKD